MSSSDIIAKIKEKNKNLSDKSLLGYIIDNGYSRTKEEINNIKREKGKGENNSSYQVKAKLLEEIENKFSSLDDLIKFMNKEELSVEFIFNKYFTNFSLRSFNKIINQHPAYIKKFKFSEEELKLQNIIDSIFSNYEIIRNSRKVIPPKEIDFYIPELNLGIEYNGDYWHSNEVIKFNHNISGEKYHRNKFNLCKEKGINLLFVWSEDLKNNEDEIINLLKNKDFNNPIFHKFSVEPLKE